MITDRIGDFVIRLKNGGAIGAEVVPVPHSKHLEAIAHKLKQLGFVESVQMSKKDPRVMEVTLAYDEKGNHKIHDVKRVSKPGRRMYTGARDAHSVKHGTGARILSTPKGILSDKEARAGRVGGEDLFQIW